MRYILPLRLPVTGEYLEILACYLMLGVSAAVGVELAAGVVLDNSLLISFGIGVLFIVLGWKYSYEFIGLFSSDDRVAYEAGLYMKYRALGIPFFLLAVSYRGFFYGIGHTKIFMFSAIVSYFFNIIFNFLLIFGMYGFPKMGLAGAGLAASIGMFLGFIFFLLVTFLPVYRSRYKYYDFFSIGFRHIKKIVQIALPVSFQNILVLLGFLIFVAITGILGTLEQASTQVVITAMFLSFMPCFGFGITAQTRVGNALGEHNPTEAHACGTETAKIATVFTFCVGLLFWFAPDVVLKVITTNHDVINMARPLLKLAGVSQIAYGSGTVLAYALQSAGATVFVMVVEIMTHWILFLPIAYFLGLRYGIQGAWAGFPIYILAYSLILGFKFRSRSWTKLKV